MSPEYEKIIDPLISSLLEIIQRAPGMTIQELSVELREEFDRANSLIEPGDREWKYASYALVSWVDSEIILNHNRWKDETLESHYFKSGNAYTEFFLKAELAFSKRYFNAFEVFYICFMFGYHGVYQAGDRTVIPRSLPASDAEWQKKASSRLAQIRKSRKKGSWSETRPDDWDNLPLHGYRSFVNYVVLFIVILMVAAAAIWFQQTSG